MKIKPIVRSVCLLLCSLLLFSLSVPTNAVELGAIPDTSGAKAVYFANLDSGTVIKKQGGGESLNQGSATKLMTGLLSIELLSDRLGEHITVTAEMIADSKGTSMNLAPYDVIKAEDLLYAAICGGYNDAAYVLAHAACGSAEDFVAAMNQRAAELGANNTHYTNPTGYDDPNMYSTLEDTVIIAKAAAKNELYLKISSTISKKIELQGSGDSFTLHNRNALIGDHYSQGYKNSYAEGLSAGYTDLGGYCVITKAIIKGTSYLCVVLGGQENESGNSSYNAANLLIRHAAESFSLITLMDENEPICDIPVDLALTEANRTGEDTLLSVRTAKKATAFLPIDTDLKRISYKYYLYSERLTAPVKADTVVGRIDYYLGDEYLTSAALVVSSDIEANGFLSFLNTMRDAIISRTTVLSLIFFILLLPVRHIFLYRKKSKRRTKNIGSKH